MREKVKLARPKREKRKGRQPLLRSNSTRQPGRAHARTHERNGKERFPVGLTPQPPMHITLVIVQLSLNYNC